MTKSQLMSLYLHNLREQSRMHLYGLMKNIDLEKMMSTLKNKGMTKALQKEAYNPIMIDDILDVAFNHIDEMTSYASYFPAIVDMQKSKKRNLPDSTMSEQMGYTIL